MFPNDVERIKRGTLPGTPALFQKDVKSNHLTFGDSHVISAWLEGSKCSRNDGLTLHGALSRGFDSYIDEMGIDNLTRLRLYLGNIDVRHHLCRIYRDEIERLNATCALAKRYIQEALRIRNKYKIDKVEIVELLPIENAARRLPKTGFYKDQPFWGSVDDRMRVVQLFNSVLRTEVEKHKQLKLIPWPQDYVYQSDQREDGSKHSGIFKGYKTSQLIFKKGMLKFSVMEKPHSVHIAPSFYLWSIT